MLRKLILKNREIPIPVPVITVGDVVRWIEDTLLRKDAVLTSAILEDKELINDLYRKSIKDIRLKESSRFQIKIETPKDLSNQSLDVVCDLAYGIAARIKKMALDSWQEFGAKPISDLEDVHSDVQVLLDLIAHINGLVEGTHVYLGPINTLGERIGVENAQVHALLLRESWIELALLLGKRLEPALRDLAREGESLQLSFLTENFGLVG